ncbi:MAG TPA: gamma-glutamylcyclotransferase [Leptolyngbyaceae cyanobacterium M65_K2018_010]|nr:gamma-glutamylcyclotransferase [Leptolyngbyaceae cyanobacterium M65_K2018_010]
MTEAEASTCRLFVYGTLKPGERAYGKFFNGSVRAIQAAIVPGRLYHLPGLGYPALTLEQGWVRGVLLTLMSPNLLEPLDEFEEYYPNHLQESAYYRIRHPVHSLEKQPLGQAWVYTMPKEQVIALGGWWLAEGWWSSDGVRGNGGVYHQ